MINGQIKFKIVICELRVYTTLISIIFVLCIVGDNSAVYLPPPIYFIIIVIIFSSIYFARLVFSCAYYKHYTMLNFATDILFLINNCYLPDIYHLLLLLSLLFCMLNVTFLRSTWSMSYIEGLNGHLSTAMTSLYFIIGT